VCVCGRIGADFIRVFFCRAASSDLAENAGSSQFGGMQNRSTYEPAEKAEQSPIRAPSRGQASFFQRLWRNQLGILIAVALTFAAAAILWMSRQV